ncbi:MAG: hypothetical protein AAGD32_00035 [Planctomycetota bacterium]
MTDPYTNAPMRYQADRSNASGLGIAGLILGGIAIFIAWIPCVNVVAAVMAVVGLALAGVGLFAAMGDKRVARGFPIAGLLASVMALVVFVGSYVVVGLAVEKGVEEAKEGFAEANANARVEMIDRAGALLDEATAFIADPDITQAERDRLTDLTDRIAAELEKEEDAGFGNNLKLGGLLLELESRLQVIKNRPTTLPAEVEAFSTEFE